MSETILSFENDDRYSEILQYLNEKNTECITKYRSYLFIEWIATFLFIVSVLTLAGALLTVITVKILGLPLVSPWVYYLTGITIFMVASALFNSYVFGSFYKKCEREKNTWRLTNHYFRLAQDIKNVVHEYQTQYTLWCMDAFQHPSSRRIGSVARENLLPRAFSIITEGMEYLQLIHTATEVDMDTIYQQRNSHGEWLLYVKPATIGSQEIFDDTQLEEILSELKTL